MDEKVKICCLNLSKDIYKHLSSIFDAYDGSLGKIVNVASNNNRFNTTHLLLNYEFPQNVHEYELFISDLNNIQSVDYISNEHKRETIIGDSAYYFVSHRPETIFNPIPYGCGLLRSLLHKGSRPIINIIFHAKKLEIEYTTENTALYCDSKQTHTMSNYMLSAADFTAKTLYGKEVEICNNKIAKALFTQFEDEIEYYQTFKHPLIYDNEQREYIPDKDFIPLLKNKHGHIISYIWCSDSETCFMLPQMKSKKQFLERLFNEVLYPYFSEYFPFIEKNSWKNQKQYFLPNQQLLQEEKEEIIRKYEKDIKEIDQKLINNKVKYNFLYDILTESGDSLVQAIIKYFKWLGFENVLDKDETINNDIFEEDIQVDLGDKGLLIIEAKGLFGTSKDSECAQISKIRYRRSEERGRFDVHALYIVNNERGIEPLKRTIPPFNDVQIKDAVNDKRGLLYTWQLFNLYFNIEEGFITKKEARERLCNIGLIDLSPTLINLGKPYKYYKERTVVCIDLNNIPLSQKDFLAYEKDGRYHKLEIIRIEQKKIPVDQVSNGKIGIEVRGHVPNIEMLFLIKHRKED